MMAAMQVWGANDGVNVAIGGHMKNFIDACRTRNYKSLNDEIEIAHLSAGMCHLANISYRTGRALVLDGGPKFVNDAEASELLTRDYRKPYVL